MDFSGFLQDKAIQQVEMEDVSNDSMDSGDGAKEKNDDEEEEDEDEAVSFRRLDEAFSGATAWSQQKFLTASKSLPYFPISKVLWYKFN